MTDSHGSDLLESHTIGTADGRVLCPIGMVKKFLFFRIPYIAIAFLLLLLSPWIGNAQTTWVAEFTGMNGGALKAEAPVGQIFSAGGSDFVTVGPRAQTG